MRFSLLPRNDTFFELFNESAETINQASIALLDLMEHYENVPEKVSEIKRLEEIGDTIIRRTMNDLHKAFITPIDRDDIALLGERLDDVLDCIEEGARYMLEYHIETPTESAKEMCRIIVRCSEVIKEAMSMLQHRRGKLNSLLALKDQLNSLETEADQVTSRAMGELFESYEAIDIIKWKEVYGQLEDATDRCEEIAAIVEGIVIKNG